MGSANYWSRFQRQRITRRRLLATSAAGAAGLAFAAACGGSGSSGGIRTGQPDLVGTPGPGGTIVAGTTTPPTFGLDPQTDVALGLVIFPRMYGYMLHQDPRDESILLDHAAAQPETTEDGLEITISLQPDIHFQNFVFSGLEDIGGRAVEARDVKASFERWEANPFVTGTKTWHRDILERIETPDAQTVTFVTNQPYTYSWETIGSITAGAIIPEEHANLDEVKDLNNGGVGSGPFIIDEANLDTEISIRRNPDYFKAPVPYLENMIWRIIRDPGTLKAAFQARQVDAFIPDSLPEAEEVAKSKDGDWEAQVYETPSLAYQSFSMNVGRDPFGDVRVRQAVSLAIDRQELISKVAFDAGSILGPINQNLRDGFWALPTSELEEAYGLNMSLEERRQTARDLLSAAGADGAEIEVKYPNLPDTADGVVLVQQHLEAVGLNISLVPQELAVWFVGYRQADFQATYQPHLPYESPLIPSRFFYSLGPSGDRSFFDYKNEEIDALIERSWTEFDDEQRKATMLELQRKILTEHGPMLNLYTDFTRAAYWSYVQGARPDLPGSLQQYVYDQYLINL